MNYKEILKQLETIQESLYNDGCHPVAELVVTPEFEIYKLITATIDELNYARANNLIK